MEAGGSFVYVSHHNGRHVRVLRLDRRSGALTTVQEARVSGTAWYIALRPDRRFLYVALRSQPYAVATFAVNPLSGELTHLADSPLPDSMAYLSTDRTGRYLFAAAISADKSKPRKSMVSVSPIGPHGIVQPPHQIIRTGPKAHCVLPDVSNRHVFVALCDGDEIIRFGFDDTTGRFAPDARTAVRTKPHSGPRQFLFHPNHRFFYVLSEPDAAVYVYACDARDGSLTEIQVVSALPPGFAEKHAEAPSTDVGAGIGITPDGRFLYTSERVSHTLAAFRIDLSTGLLTPVSHYATEKRPHGFAIEPHGRWLLVAGEHSSRMAAYAIDVDTGQLSRQNEAALGDGPNCVKILNLP
jgi:6-phosphogluconolactonase